MAVKIQLRRGSAAQWTAANPVLATGEMALETDTGKRKIGNGVLAWADLPYEFSADDVAPVATSGDYADLTGKPDLGTEARLAIAQLTRPTIIGREPEAPIVTFAPGHGWVKSGVNGTVNLNDTSDGVLSSQVISVTGSGSSAIVQGEVSPAIDLQSNLLRVYVGVDDLEKLKSVRFEIGDTTSFSNSFTEYLGYNDGTNDPVFIEGEQWHVLTLDFLDPTNRTQAGAGVTSLANVGALRMYVKDIDAGGPVTVKLGGVTTVPRARSAFPNGVISFTIDDGRMDNYTKFRPMLAAYDMRPTAYIIQGLLGSPNYMTLDQVKRLHHLNRWEIGHHAFDSSTHTNDYDSLSDAQIHADFQSAKEWARVNDLGPLNHHAWPHGRSDVRVRNIAMEYMTSAVGTTTSILGQPFSMSNRDALFRMNRIPVDNTYDVATYPTKHLDPILANKTWGIFMCHNMDDSTENSTTVRTDKMQALVDGIVARGIPVMPVGEVIDILGKSST